MTRKAVSLWSELFGLNSLNSIRRRATRRIVQHARTIVPDASGVSFGAIDIDPKHLTIWIKVKTDAQKDQLAQDPAVSDKFKEILLGAGYPSAAVTEVAFEFESQETVDRDFDGSWWYAMK